MFYFIKTHIHIDKSIMKTIVNHVTHHSYVMLVFHLFLLFFADAEGTLTQLVLHWSCRCYFNPNGLTLHCVDETLTQMVCSRCRRDFNPIGLTLELLIGLQTVLRSAFMISFYAHAFISYNHHVHPFTHSCINYHHIFFMSFSTYHEIINSS
jgi:hypothetical protein